MKRKRSLGKIVRNIFIVFSLVIFAGLIIFYFIYGRKVLEFRERAIHIARESSVDSFKAEQTSIVYASDGTILTTLKAEKDVYYLTFESIPKSAIDAVLVTEDKKFYSHGGVDYLANIRAIIALIKHKGEINQGASTITQQLARNVFLTNEVSLERKLTEIFLAEELEKKYSKKQILEFYFNNIYYANGYYGIQSASKGYFSKSVNELTLSEIAFLSAIPNSPTMLDPLEHFEDTMERRDKILVQMLHDNVISKSDYDNAISEEIVLKPTKKTKHNYAESYTFYCAIRALMKQEGFEFKTVFMSLDEKKEYQAAYNELYYRMQRQLYTKGYRIYTSLDMKKQKLLQKAVDDQLQDFKEVNEEGIFALQGAAVSIDNDSGRVVAIVGGRGQKTKGYTLNRAYQSYRQPGSSIKPLLVYTPMFERGIYPDTMVVDKKMEEGPKNAGSTYVGKTTVRRAVELSLNSVAWNMFRELTPSIGISYLLNMNFSRIVSEDYNLGLSIGGFTYGVSPIEMTSGFATLANDGSYRMPTCIVQITDAEGNDIVGSQIEETAIYQMNASRMMTNVLTGVMTNGTGRRLQLDHMTSAGKTGTTTDEKDGWFVGYTKYYTTGVWVGYDYPKALEGLAGNTYPGYIWQQYMNAIHKNLEDLPFGEYIDNRSKEDLQKDSSENIGNEGVNNQEQEEENDDQLQDVMEPMYPITEDTTNKDNEKYEKQEDMAKEENETQEDIMNEENMESKTQKDIPSEENLGDMDTNVEDNGSKINTESDKKKEPSEDGIVDNRTNGTEDSQTEGNQETDDEEEEPVWDEEQWMEEQWPNE